jgi:hypothetical protein
MCVGIESFEMKCMLEFVPVVGVLDTVPRVCFPSCDTLSAPLDGVGRGR